MRSIPRSSKKGKKNIIKGEAKTVSREAYKDMEMSCRLSLIQQLIPIGMMAVAEELQREVDELAGPRYQRKRSDGEPSRYGTNPGTVVLAGQKMPVRVPRVRNDEGEIPLKSYERLHRGGEFDEALFRRVLYGISCRDYDAAATAIPGAIGISKSSVSRSFIEASAKELKTFQERDLSDLDIVAMFIDGKSFADDMMVIAMGVTIDGEKVFLGFVQTETENKRVLSHFLQSIIDRGLDISMGLLAIVDGSKGLISAIKKTFKKRVLIQRCQWHKRENVIGHMQRSKQTWIRKRMQRAYERPTYEEAKDKLDKLKDELDDLNQSAAASLQEGFEETLTLHRLGVFNLLGRSLKTTNCLESVNSMAEQRCAKIDYWKNSSQKQRWLASALIDIEPRLNKVHGYKHLPKLREAIMKELKIEIAIKDVA